MTACPMCKARVSAPTFDDAVRTYGLEGFEAVILKAIWNGNGFPVVTSQIFEMMYADDPDGGPAPDVMYRAFNVALRRIREKLLGSGIRIASVGFRRGYRISLR
ncbi:MAG: hypothetical protein GC182_14845 [Rhodopseudomonas sp.]|nr:hypothetical protein [Rhodopseudomonas sp.]